MATLSRTDACPIRLPVFEGPLDLLLQVIEREELDITRIALAQVTDQFLAYVRWMQLDNGGAGSLADYLVVAAQLTVIKSQALLPRSSAIRKEDEPDSGDELMHQLTEYRRYKQAAQALQQRTEDGLRSYIRLAAPAPQPPPGDGLDGATLCRLQQLLARALALEPPAPPISEVVILHPLAIGDQIALIESRLAAGLPVNFVHLLTQGGGRVEVVVTLLAALELIKRRHITCRQEALFGPIWLERVHGADSSTGTEPGST